MTTINYARTLREGLAAAKPYKPNGASDRPPTGDDAWPSDDRTPSRFRIVDLSALNEPRPPLRWYWAGYLPAGHATLLGGHGGAGKSDLALMLAACIAIGEPCLGRATLRARVLYFSAEDAAPLVLLKLARICRALGLDADEVRAGLTVLDATEGEPVLFAESRINGARVGATTASYAALAEQVEAAGAEVLIVDNASDAFDGDEIHRASVRRFVRSLVQLVRERDGAALLLSHVDKVTSRAGKSDEAYSGSTAWHNSVRSRLYLRQVEPGRFELQQQKRNVDAGVEPPLALDWPPDDVLRPAGAGGIVQAIDERNNLRDVLRLIHEFTQRGEYVGAATTSRTHAGKLLIGQPGYPPRLKERDLFNLLRDAERREWLARSTIRSKGRGHEKDIWRVTLAGIEAAGIEAPTAPTAPTPDVAAEGAEGAEAAAPTAPTSAPGGVGGNARAQQSARKPRKAQEGTP